MTTKETIITNVLTKLQGAVANECLDKIESTLIIELGDYEINKKCTDIIVDNNSSIKLLKRFIANKRLIGLSELTLKRYYEQNINMLNWIGKELGDITTDDIRLYLAYRKSENKLCNNTVDGMRRCITSMYNFLYAEGLIEHNPATALRCIKVEKKVKKAFSDNQVEELRHGCVGLRDKTLVEFLYSTGCRVSECIRVDLKSVDFENKSISVLGKGNKERIVYFSDKCSDLIQKYVKNRDGCSPALFIGRNGERLSKNRIEAIVKEIGNRSGVGEVYPHRFRRTCATTLIRKGMDIQSVARILGHESLNTTRIYIDLEDSEIRQEYMKCMGEV